MRRPIVHKLKWDDEGVASTVGTIMALLVFLTFLSMIVNSYVPVWMKDSESSHMNVAYGQFGGLKGAIDMQMLGGSMYQLAGQHFTPITTFSPITMGVDGVPIFAAPTLGTLGADQNAGPWSIAFNYLPSKFSNTYASVNQSASGSVTLQVYNRYFVQQTLAYENGGVLTIQPDGMLVGAEPTFEVSIYNNNVTYSLVMISMLGSGSLQGTTTEGIHAKVVSVDTESYAKVNSTNVQITHTSPFGLAWFAFYNKTLGTAFNLTSDSYKTCTSDTYVGPTLTSYGYCYTVTRGGQYGILTQMIRNPYFRIALALNQTSGNFNLVIQLHNDYGNTIPKSMPIATLRIETAVVNMAVGGIGAQFSI